jgi:hypothetical protein
MNLAIPPKWTIYLPVWLLRCLFRFNALPVANSWPPAPSCATHRVLYQNLVDSRYGMILYRFPDGSLHEFYTLEPWQPDEHWEFEKEEPI